MSKKVPAQKCVALAGSHQAGFLLYRMLHFNRLPKMYRNGEFWMVNSNEKWAEEGLLTDKQLRMAMLALKRRGLIRSEIHLFKNRTHAFIQLAGDALKLVSGEALEGVTGEAQKGATGSAQMGGPYKNGVLEGSSVMELTNGEPVLTDVPASNFGTEEAEETEEEDGMKSPKGMKSVADLAVAGSCNEKAHTLLHAPDKVGSLELFWKQRVSKITGAFIALSVKERGMLSQLIKLCPKGKALAILDIVLDDWPFYAKKVQTAAGLPYVPMSPRIDFLLKFRADAIMLWTAAENAKKHEAISPPVVSPPPVQLAATKDDEDMDYEISFEDLIPTKGKK